MVSPLTLKNAFFAVPSLEIFGHTILATGSTPTADLAAEIESSRPPPDIKNRNVFSAW
jgi:hypothetical protein